MMKNSLGQLMMTGISGLALTAQEREFLTKEDLGGVILFAYNYESPAQVAELINEIQKCRKDKPMFIAVDHEGGRVFRFKKHFTQFPPMYQIARLDSPKICFDVHSVLARELAAVGVNVNFAPCCDIWTNPVNKVIGDRSFGHTADHVEKFVSAAIRGMQLHGVISCAKHFPGHGTTIKDSHFDLPIVETSLDEMKEREFVPFNRAVKSKCEMVMMAHLLVDSIDKEYPTSVSARAHELVRNELRFNRLIITDDMEMKAIFDRYGIKDAGVLALEAGSDVVLYRTVPVAKEALEGIKEAVSTKRLKADQLDQKFQRINDLKIERLSDYRPIYIPEIEKSVGLETSVRLAQELRDKIASLPIL